MSKKNLLGVLVDGVDYATAVDRIMEAAGESRPLSVSALAVHGVMTGVMDEFHRYRLNHLDLVTPDGQPVKWGLNLLHGTRLQDRVYGPVLMLKLCESAAQTGIPIFLYGSEKPVLTTLAENLKRQFPTLEIAGAEPSRFTRTTIEEKEEIAEMIRSSGAKLTFVGLGCPRQEIFVYEYRDALQMPVIAVGAAFDYHSGTLREPSERIQSLGLQWAYRLLQDPRRLWRRYLMLNPAYLALLLAQRMHLWRPRPENSQRPAYQVLYG